MNIYYFHCNTYWFIISFYNFQVKSNKVYFILMLHSFIHSPGHLLIIQVCLFIHPFSGYRSFIHSPGQAQSHRKISILSKLGSAFINLICHPPSVYSIKHSGCWREDMKDLAFGANIFIGPTQFLLDATALLLLEYDWY